MYGASFGIARLVSPANSVPKFPTSKLVSLTSGRDRKCSGTIRKLYLNRSKRTSTDDSFHGPGRKTTQTSEATAGCHAGHKRTSFRLAWPSIQEMDSRPGVEKYEKSRVHHAPLPLSRLRSFLAGELARPILSLPNYLLGTFHESIPARPSLDYLSFGSSHRYRGFKLSPSGPRGVAAPGPVELLRSGLT